MSKATPLTLEFSQANVIAIHPEPVPTSQIRTGFCEAEIYFSADSTSSSVSGRGIKTSGETRNTRP